MLALWGAGALLGHDLSLETRVAGEAVLVTAVYGGSEPAAFCQVSIFSPGKAESEFQTGRTDARGRFAFQPDVRGTWRVVADDEMGHRATATVEWTGAGGGESAAAQPGWQKALTGAALLMGLTGMWLWWRVRERL
ncbi:MAG: hypothetical protein NTX13_13890 [Acidobacteria bacterium]|nr:hypothetical protein [Acidobacteriota bacterium]